MSKERPNITVFQVGPDSEKDIIYTEELLMKLAQVDLMLTEMDRYINHVAECDCTDNTVPLDKWAIVGTRRDLGKVSHALKCGCWGHEVAFMH